MENKATKARKRIMVNQSVQTPLPKQRQEPAKPLLERRHKLPEKPQPVAPAQSSQTRPHAEGSRIPVLTRRPYGLAKPVVPQRPPKPQKKLMPDLSHLKTEKIKKKGDNFDWMQYAEPKGKKLSEIKGVCEGKKTGKGSVSLPNLGHASKSKPLVPINTKKPTGTLPRKYVPLPKITEKKNTDYSSDDSDLYKPPFTMTCKEFAPKVASSSSGNFSQDSLEA